jgi:hypothetical protein
MVENNFLHAYVTTVMNLQPSLYGTIGSSLHRLSCRRKSLKGKVLQEISLWKPSMTTHLPEQQTYLLFKSSDSLEEERGTVCFGWRFGSEGNDDTSFGGDVLQTPQQLGAEEGAIRVLA